jgi:ubiquinone/menaquinone biosynthesis C-methylase UbiE
VYDEGYEARVLAKPAVHRRLAVMERDLLVRTQGYRRVLDIGCGTGRFTSQLKVHEAIGIDKSRAMLEVARRRNVTCILGDAHALPFGAGEFDAVVSTDLVFIALDVEKVLVEAHRVLAPGGLLAFNYPAYTIWTPRRPFGLTLIPGPQGKSAPDVITLAETLGFTTVAQQLWRWLRGYPYLVRVPSLIRLPIWSGCMLFFRK